MSDSRAAANQELRTKNSQNPNLTNIMKTKKILALLISGVFATTMASQGAVITMPSGLSAGDQYRLVFVTSTTTTATSTDINTYNTFVNNLAITAGLDTIAGTVEGSTTWTAIGSTSSVNAIDNTSTTGAGTGIGIYLLNDTAIATSYTDLWDDSIATPLNVDELGASYGNEIVWTGSKSNGLNEGILTLGNTLVNFGQTNSTVGSWMDRNIAFDGTQNRRLYAMSGILTVPEPSSTALLGLGGLALMLRRKRS